MLELRARSRRRFDRCGASHQMDAQPGAFQISRDSVPMIIGVPQVLPLGNHKIATLLQVGAQPLSLQLKLGAHARDEHCPHRPAARLTVEFFQGDHDVLRDAFEPRPEFPRVCPVLVRAEFAETTGSGWIDAKKVVAMDLAHLVRQLLIGLRWLFEDRHDLALAAGLLQPPQELIKLLSALVGIEIGPRDDRNKDGSAAQRVRDFLAPWLSDVKPIFVPPYLHVSDQVFEPCLERFAKNIDPPVLSFVGSPAVADEKIILNLRQISHGRSRSSSRRKGSYLILNCIKYGCGKPQKETTRFRGRIDRSYERIDRSYGRKGLRSAVSTTCHNAAGRGSSVNAIADAATTIVRDARAPSPRRSC